MSKYYKPSPTTILYLNSAFNCVKSSSLNLAITSGGTGYTSAPTISFVNASGDSGYSASATCTVSGGIINTITVTNNGTGYNKLPSIALSGGGSPGVITSYSGLVGGSGYALPPNLTVSGGGGSGFLGSTALTATTVSSTFTITNGGTGYVTGDVINFNNTGTGGGSNVSATVIATAGVITGITLTNAGSGYTLKAPLISSITSVSGSGAVISCSLTPTSVGSITIINGGSNYNTIPAFVFTPVSGGTLASATPTVNLGTPAVLSPSFYKTFNYTWNIPDVVINDLGKLSAISLIASGFSTTTPYVFRLLGLQIDSRNSFYSDYGNPILTMSQNVNIANNDALASESIINLSSQTIRQIQISTDDSISTLNSGIAYAINFIIAIKIEEYDPSYTQIGDTYSESASRLKTLL